MPGMHRRTVLAALTCCAGACAQATGQDRPQQRISAATLHHALARRFPARFALAGLFEAVVSAPRLLLLAPRNKLGAALEVQAGGAALQQLPAGELDLVFAVRYEPRDHSLRAHDPELLDLRWPALPPQALDGLRSVLPVVAREALGEIELHRFSPGDLALADTMGFEPDRVTVTDDGIVLTFAPKRPR